MYEKALRMNSGDYRVWMGLALTERWLGDDTKAMNAYSHALPLLETLAKSRPNDATVQSRLGLFYARFHRREKAIERLEAGIALDPKDNSVMERMGEAYEALGDRRKGLEWLTKALSHGYSLDSLKHNPEVRSMLSDPNFKLPTK
jgi:eukaryotic-like serine/threonine-protein kinase